MDLMDLPNNEAPVLSKAIVASGMLKQPFVVVDVGVYGGEHPRWNVLGDHLYLYGFDARKEAIDPLAQHWSGSTRRFYFNSGIGNEDGIREFQVVDNVASSSFYKSPTASIGRSVPIRRLDGLIADETIQAPNFIKVDVEGYEKYVFMGAANAIATTVLAVEFETNFNHSPEYPTGHLAMIHDLLRPHGFFLADMTFDRHRGLPSTFDVLFCREPRTPDEIVKLAIIHDLYRHETMARDILAAHPSAGSLVFNSQSQPLTVNLQMETSAAESKDCLGQQSHEVELQFLRDQLSQLKGSISWRCTAPLRAIRRLIF